MGPKPAPPALPALAACSHGEAHAAQPSGPPGTSATSQGPWDPAHLLPQPQEGLTFGLSGCPGPA
eukprot:1921226-Lingulodinium_polyedra.AAC.1